MSTQQPKSSKMSPSIDTSHLKVKFPFKSKYGNFIGGMFSLDNGTGRRFLTKSEICVVEDEKN
jgi:hypothetical protein